MNNQVINKKKKKKGFTLVELVAVVAIIGILAAILVPKVTSYMNEAKKVKVIDQSRKVITAIESYNMKNDIVIPKNDVTITNLFTTYPAIKAFVDGETDKIAPDTITVKDVYDIVEEKKDFNVTNQGVFNGMVK